MPFDLKPQVVRNTSRPTDADFRGAKRLGEADGDNHRTISHLEFENLPDSLADEAIRVCTAFNEFMLKVEEAAPEQFRKSAQAAATFLGLKGEGDVMLDLRVYDHD